MPPKKTQNVAAKSKKADRAPEFEDEVSMTGDEMEEERNEIARNSFYNPVPSSPDHSPNNSTDENSTSLSLARLVDEAPKNGSYLDMVINAIKKIDQKNGATVISIRKYVLANYRVELVPKALRKSLIKGVESGVLKRPKKTELPINLSGRYALVSVKPSKIQKVHSKLAIKVKPKKTAAKSKGTNGHDQITEEDEPVKGNTRPPIKKPTEDEGAPVENTRPSSKKTAEKAPDKTKPSNKKTGEEFKATVKSNARPSRKKSAEDAPVGNARPLSKKKPEDAPARPSSKKTAEDAPVENAGPSSKKTALKTSHEKTTSEDESPPLTVKLPKKTRPGPKSKKRL